MEKGLEKEFVPYAPSLRLKAIGFDEPCFGYYSFGDELIVETTKYQLISEGCCSAPTFQCAFDWFREEHGYCSYIREATKGKYRFCIEKFDEKFFNSDIYNTYGEAKLALLKKLLGYVESKKNEDS